MIKVIFECDECGQQYKTEVIDINDEILNYMPEGWYIINEDMADEKIVCQDCFLNFEELQENL
jgi:protein-arginine kinase activator protein McsA